MNDPPQQNQQSLSIQIDMESNSSGANPRNGNSSLRSLGRGFLDGVRRVMLPIENGFNATTTNNHNSHSSSLSINPEVNVFRQQQQPEGSSHLNVSNSSSSISPIRPSASLAHGSVLAQHHYVPYHTAVEHLPQVATAIQMHPLPPNRQPDMFDARDMYPPIGGGTDNNEARPAGGGAGGGGGGGATPDENQRRVESLTDAMAQHPELKTFIMSILKTLPFVALILVKVSYDHFNSLINLAFICSIFLQSNHHLVKEVAKKMHKNTKKLYFHLTVIVFGLFIKWSDDPFILDIITLTSYKTVHSFAELVYYLLMADQCHKMITVGVKTVITLLPERIVEFKGRGRIYLLVEAISQFYRCFLPLQPWVAYLLNNYEGYERIFGTLLVVIYNYFKFREVLAAGKFLKDSYIKFKQNSNFGTTPSSEEMSAAGGQCPICHESFSCPIALECSHIFCDLCIGVWFDRETTCPLCRKKIADDPRYRDGSTSVFCHIS